MAIELPEKFEHAVQNAADEWLETGGMDCDSRRTFIEKRVIRDQEKSPKLACQKAAEGILFQWW